jgi:dienelactone hydrolase
MVRRAEKRVELKAQIFDETIFARAKRATDALNPSRQLQKANHKRFARKTEYRRGTLEFPERTRAQEHAKNLLASLLWLMIADCAANLPELKGPLEPGEELVTLSTRPGVTVRVLLITRDTDPKAIVIYFPGGGGTLVASNGNLRHAVFISYLSAQPFITAVVDMPSDHPGGVAGTDRFRAGKEYTKDIEKVVDFLRQKWSKPVFLVGHSGGTTSVAHLGAVLKDQHITGLVMMAAISTHRGAGVSLPNLHEITYPVLFIHHREDQCVSFEGVRQQLSRLTKSPKVDFIEVLGGDRSKARQCSPFAARQGPESYGHFFAGKEREVFQAITNWIIGKPVPDRLGP